MKEIVRIQFGSHLYGTNTPESDIDFKAVHIPSGRDILLQRVSNSVHNKRPKPEGEKNAIGEVDEESYSLQRYLGLLTDGQTVAIDMLFAPNAHLLSQHAIWQDIQHNRSRLLTRRSTAFVGYCRTQANKYGIKGSRVAAAKETSEFFAAKLPTHSLAKVGEFAEEFRTLLCEHTRIVEQVVNSAGDFGTFLECCNRKVDYSATVKQAHSIFGRIYEGYGSRARLAQDNQGVDWKALSHAVRVGTEALELLATGNITFPLANAPHLLDIKRGRLPYAAVAEEIEKLLIEVDDASTVSVLPEDADRQFIDDLVSSAYLSAVLEPDPAASTEVKA